MATNSLGLYNVLENVDADDYEIRSVEDGNERILELSLDSPEMIGIRRFVAFQRLPARIFPRASKRWNAVFQSFIVIVVFCHYLYTLGAFNNKTLEEQEMGLTLNFFKIVVWNSRHLLFAVFGSFYFTSTHIDDFVRNLKLTSRSLKKVKRWLKLACALIVTFSIFVPGIIQFLEMSITPIADANKQFSDGEIFGNTVSMILVRLVSIQMVIVFTIVFACLYFEVKQYKKHIQSWPMNNKAEARNFLVDFLVKCKNVERGFQPFLIVHITILVLILIPGVMSFVERAQYEGQVTYTFHTTPWHDLVAHRKTAVIAHELLGKGQNISIPIVVIDMSFNVSSKTVNDSNAQMRIWLQSVAFLAELLALYLPLILIGKTNKAIKRISEILQCLKFDEQQRQGYIFQSRAELDEMLKDLSNAHGVHILGMEITVIKTWLLAVIMPLWTLLLHIIFKHVDLAA